MMRFENPQLQAEFARAFQLPFEGLAGSEPGKSRYLLKIEDLTPAQVMWLVKFAKHVRGRCRSNAALRTYLQRAFPHLRFTEVERVYKRRGSNEEIPYMALCITDPRTKAPVTEEPETDDQE